MKQKIEKWWEKFKKIAFKIRKIAHKKKLRQIFRKC